MATPPTPLNAQERYAADAMATALYKAVVAMGKGKTDPDDPYCWDDEAAFELYGEIRNAQAAAERARFGRPRFFEATCATCLHLRPYSSGRADQPPVDRRDLDQPRTLPTSEADADAVGVCTESPPQRLHLPMSKDAHGASHCPRVHRDWVCGRWTAITRRGHP
ncbi:hypothetical protein [Sphingomonas adhaesiva]|uniref:hypothetical protein n=1 Tax=Sphingomonas adhaesiva TaxID=28212 RepID=UPI002FF960C2